MLQTFTEDKMKTQMTKDLRNIFSGCLTKY